MSLPVRSSPDLKLSSLSSSNFPDPIGSISPSFSHLPSKELPNHSQLPQAHTPLPQAHIPLPQAHTPLPPINTPDTNGSNFNMGSTTALNNSSPSPAHKTVASPTTSVSTSGESATPVKSKTSIKSKASVKNKVSAASNVVKKRVRDDNEPDLDTTPPPKTKRVQGKTEPTPRKPAAPTITRPSRARKAPERFADLDSQESSKTKAPASKPTSRVFDPEYATTNANSRLGKADLFHLLIEDGTWTCLTATQQTTLIEMLPPTPTNIRLLAAAKVIQSSSAVRLARPKELKVNYNMFRTDVAKFKQDLRNGHLAKSWLLSADQAVCDRAAGLFDQWKEDEAEYWWGQKSGVDGL